MIAYYARQSKDKKDSISIDAQIEFCDRENFNKEEYKTYIDKGFSGKNTDRPAFNDLLNDIKSGMVTKVVVYRLDRISRSILDFTSMLEIFDKHKVEFASCTEKLDTSTPAGRMVVNILIVFAQYERESIVQRTIDNTYERARMGIIVGGKSAFGYNAIRMKIGGINAYSLEEDIGNSKHLKNIFNMYVNENMSLGEIIRYYNTNNIILNRSEICSRNHLGRLLKNPIYVRADKDVYNYLQLRGCVINNDIEDFDGKHGLILYASKGVNKYANIEGLEVFVGLHEGIIDSDMWLQAQYKTLNNKLFKNDGKSKNTWLSGIAKCGYCGYAMTYQGKKSKDKIYEYLKCSGKPIGACTEDLGTWKLEKTENIVFDILKKHIENLKINIDNKKSFDLNSTELEMQLIDKKINKLIESLVDSSNVTMTYINKAIDGLHDKKKKISESIIKEKSNNVKSDIDVNYFLSNWDELKVKDKKEFAQLYIDKITLYKDKVLDIEFK